MARSKAFVIEDQANLSMLYEDTLRLVGFDVEVIRTGLDAINTLEIKDPPALITLDINLPKVSGHEVIRTVTRLNHNSEQRHGRKSQERSTPR